MTISLGNDCYSDEQSPDIFCRQPHLLSAINGSGLFADPKSTVDLPLRTPWEVALAAFDLLHEKPDGLPSPGSISTFVAEHFSAVGSDLVEHIPPDFQPSPSPKWFLPNLATGTAGRDWGVKVHGLWPALGRAVSSDVRASPGRHTLLPLPKPFIIAGDRFRELYYWDSYWILRGLLISGMPTTARHMLDNLLWMLDRFGFVPNGSRTYYLNRSQPPLLSCMVRVVYESSKDRSLLEKALPLLIKEHTYFTTGLKLVHIRDTKGTVWPLSRYYAYWEQPRPESHKQDTDCAAHLAPEAARLWYRETASAAESGWDFSARWFRDGGGMESLMTTSVVPADLNAFLYQMECNIAVLAREVEQESVAADFERHAAKRQEAMEAVLWNEEKDRWVDFLIDPKDSAPAASRDGASEVPVYVGHQRRKGTFASDFVPLWCGVGRAKDPERGVRVMDSLTKSGLILPGGVVASDVTTGQQWDFPNAWPPVQAMIVEGLEAVGTSESKALAESLAHRFMHGAYALFKETGYMSEKYDARFLGGVGGGGEYEPQVGFGWTNGVVLMFLDRYALSSPLLGSVNPTSLVR